MSAQPAFQRVLIKVSGESLLGDREYGIDSHAAEEVARKLKQVTDMGVQVAVVVGGGNIFRGLSASQQGFDRATADYMGMLATVMNGLALQGALDQLDVDNRVMSALDMPAVAELFIRHRAISQMEKGRLVILTAGIGAPYVTTDTGASLHALELHCDVVMKATKVNGIYDKDPEKFPDAKRYETMRFADAIVDENIQVMDTGALSMCMENNMPVMVFELFEGDNLIKAVKGERVGTYVSNDVETKLVAE
ncbi:UMP kinase [Candidatus Woesebacteria bacterium]|nr:UMP kinase [Candidatus Woesebacteria bacterium]MCD8507654.1 UMP kinase [Candidatus Woesebacteria bacterium]MCD8546494.1 UMP kinase [Candidatus Woesebacteria bacterium]